MEVMIQKNHSKLMLSMPEVKKYESKLNALTDWWAKVGLIGKINSHNLASIILEDMHETKEKFSILHNTLIENLLLEHFKKVVVDNTAKAQVTIDILIRNLFERTADVGFLATNEDIRCYLKQHDNTNITRDFIESRLNEYVKKYSVYNEIVILDTQGNVKANLDKSNTITVCHHELVQKTLASQDDYTETFGYCDLQAKQPYSLVYSCKITENNDSNSAVIGVLCLCFRFDNEMKAIFQNLSDDSSSTLLLMSEENRVIATSDASTVSINTSFTFYDEPQILSLQGKEYIVTCCRSNGYQGFYGLGWWSLVITPLSSAFSKVADVEKNNTVADEHLIDSELFSKDLKEIYQSSKRVNDDLSLVVLNGQITSLRQEAVEFMPVLEAIKEIGERTANIFADSVNDLQSTVISSHMDDVAFMAALAVNIMDRNLYERANDCRWWALTSDFQKCLEKPVVNEAEREHLSNILHYINELYTVYTNLYIFDRNEKIIAVSNPEEKSLIGQQLNEKTGSTKALRLTNSQEYSVSDFIESSLYDNKPTYIYNAAITSTDNQKVMGGIGIVFDSEPEFSAILNDTLPKDEHGNMISGSFALFTERTGRIISTTDNAPFSINDDLPLDKRLFEIALAHKQSEILRLLNNEYIVGVAASSGYREYKTTGDYQNDILAFIFIPV